MRIANDLGAWYTNVLDMLIILCHYSFNPYQNPMG